MLYPVYIAASQTCSRFLQNFSWFVLICVTLSLHQEIPIDLRIALDIGVRLPFNAVDLDTRDILEIWVVYSPLSSESRDEMCVSHDAFHVLSHLQFAPTPTLRRRREWWRHEWSVSETLHYRMITSKAKMAGWNVTYDRHLSRHITFLLHLFPLNLSEVHIVDHIRSSRFITGKLAFVARVVRLPAAAGCLGIVVGVDPVLGHAVVESLSLQWFQLQHIWYWYLPRLVSSKFIQKFIRFWLSEPDARPTRVGAGTWAAWCPGSVSSSAAPARIDPRRSSRCSAALQPFRADCSSR